MCNISWEIMHIDTMFGTKKYERKKIIKKNDFFFIFGFIMKNTKENKI